MINIFENSFYYGYFLHIPEDIMCPALERVHKQLRSVRINCPNLFDDIFELEAALFLNKYFGSTELSYKTNDGEIRTISTLSTSGAKSTVKRDSIDSSVSREYFKPDFLPGEEPSDFPLGDIKSQLAELKSICDNANSFTMGFGADIPCGTDHCKIVESPCYTHNNIFENNCKDPCK